MKINRRQLNLCWGLAWCLLGVLWLQPISYGIMRLAFLFCAGVIAVGGLYQIWHLTKLRWASLGLGLALSLFMLLPGQPADANALAQDYVQSLQSFQGSRYVWGGENRLGIDCSGLVRQGLIQANLKQGIRHRNPRLLRQAFELWWYDAGADALRDGYRGFTRQLFSSPSINAMDETQLRPGDLAATQDGEHILAYGGDRQWIEADPGYLEVLIVEVPEPHNNWFETPVILLRWSQLEAASEG